MQKSLADSVRLVIGGLPTALTGAATSAHLEAISLEPTLDSARRCGELLQKLGFVTAAESVFRILAEHFPERPAGFIGLAQIAMQRGHWKLALARWSQVISTFARHKSAFWLASQARVLEELGRTTEAAASLEEANRSAPRQPFTSISRAQSAMRCRTWSTALQHWDDVLAAFPEHAAVSHWQTARATALLELGRYHDAEADLRQILRVDPWMLPALQTLMRVLCAKEEHTEALREFRASLFADAELPVLFTLKARILAALGQFDEARAAFAIYMQHAANLESLESLFAEAPLLHEGWRLTQVRIALLQRLEQLPAPPTTEETAAINTLRARIKLALRDRLGFRTAARRIGTADATDNIASSLRAVAETMAKPRFPDFHKPKVFGIGLSRTGTTSLATALSVLGLRTLHWTNPLTNDLISDADLPLFDAFTDLPVCASFEKYFHMFPNSKFIYTTRPMESWLESFNRQAQKMLHLSGFEQIKAAFARGVEFHFGSHFNEIYFHLFLKHASAREAYLDYDRRVRHFFCGKRQEHFLEFSVFEGDGWPKLCRFLNAGAPEEPFPRENRGSS